MNDEWNNPILAKAYAEKLDQIDWYEHEINMPSLLSLIPKGTKSVLDFGSGPGQFTAQLAAKYSVEGVDVSSAMIAIANKAYPGISFRQWDGQTPYESDRRFDVIFSKLTIQFVPDLHKFAGFSHRALSVDGSMVLSIPHPIRVIPKVKDKYSQTTVYDGSIGAYDLHVQMIHRSFEAYIMPFIESGFVLARLQEPIISREQADMHHAPRLDCHMPKRLNLRFKRVAT